MRVSFKNIRTLANEGTILFNTLSFLLITVAIILGGKFVSSAVQNGATTEAWSYLWGTAWFICLGVAIFSLQQSRMATSNRDRGFAYLGIGAGSLGISLCLILPLTILGY